MNQDAPVKSRGRWLWGAIAIAVLVVAAFVLLRPRNDTTMGPSAGVATDSGTAPAPWVDPPGTASPAPLGALDTPAPLGATNPTTALTPSPSAAATGAPQSAVSQAPGAPWEFDVANNRHFDPTHNHWHDGPPPPASARAGAPNPATSSSAAAPAPWTYDQANNQHWDPNHRHWHQGPPPPEGSR